MNRPSKIEYYLALAGVVASRSTCLRRHFGSVIVSTDDRIISTGYNGPAKGESPCETCERERLKIPSGERYEICRAAHSENNAVIFSDPISRRGATLYLAGFEVATGQPIVNPRPCLLCSRVLRNSGIHKITTQISTEVII